MSTTQSNKMNMSLDDIIKQSKSKFSKTRGGNNRRNFGERRRYNDRNTQKNNTTISLNAAPQEEKRSRLFVSNLQKDIINSELRKIFSSVGALKRCQIHWDEMGYSKGTAEVQYEKWDDAQKAIRDYNEAEIEGVTMKVEYAKGGMARRDSQNNDRKGQRQRRSKIGMRNEQRNQKRNDGRRNVNTRVNSRARGGLANQRPRRNANANLKAPRMRLGVRRNLRNNRNPRIQQ